MKADETFPCVVIYSIPLDRNLAADGFVLRPASHLSFKETRERTRSLDRLSKDDHVHKVKISEALTNSFPRSETSVAVLRPASPAALGRFGSTCASCSKNSGVYCLIGAESDHVRA